MELAWVTLAIVFVFIICHSVKWIANFYEMIMVRNVTANHNNSYIFTRSLYPYRGIMFTFEAYYFTLPQLRNFEFKYNRYNVTVPIKF